MEQAAFAVVALGILAFGLVSGRLDRSIVTPPMAFVVFGLLVSEAGLGLVAFEVDREIIHLLAEVTLVLVLFSDASRIDLRLLVKEHDIPIRLLGIGLPLTIVAGAAIALVLFPELGIWAALVLAVILAPTDAALGQAVVSNPSVPVRIRQALNVESGLNDGIALPILLLFVSFAVAAAGGTAAQDASYWIVFTAKQIGLGPLIGLAIGYVGSRLLQRASNAGWINEVFLKLSAVGLALLAFGAAELVHGNGFIAAFCAGLVLGNVAQDICPKLYEFGEAEGQLLGLLTFMVFGGLMVPEAIPQVSWPVVAYALISLTAIRMLPVAVSLIGARLAPPTILFLGWFGPRGIAPILYGLLILENADIPGKDTILAVMVVTVLLSVFLHGLTAYPLATLYGRQAQVLKSADADCTEHAPVTEMPLRFGGRR